MSSVSRKSGQYSFSAIIGKNLCELLVCQMTIIFLRLHTTSLCFCPQYVFGSLMSRDNTYKKLVTIWKHFNGVSLRSANYSVWLPFDKQSVYI